MSHSSIAFAGMDRADEEEIRTIFDRASAAIGGGFETAPEDEAAVLVVDVDTIHGHMTWLRVHNDPERIVVAVSARQTPHADHCLVRPVTVESLAAVLAELRGTHRQPTVEASDPAPVPDEDVPAGPEESAPPAPVEPETGLEESAQPAPVAEVPARSDALAGQDADEAPHPGPGPAVPVKAPERRRLGDYLVPGALPGPSRLAFPAAPDLVVDPGARAYLGPAQLKGFAPYAQATEITPEQWQPVNAAELSALAGSLGSPQPWLRLTWLSGLYRSPGELAPGHTLEDRFTLLKWPQIEREFPRHFRIATAMMKGPATAAEIAEAAGTPLEEVIDFINASLAAGQAERVVEETPPEDAPAKSGGLLGRLKGLRGN